MDRKQFKEMFATLLREGEIQIQTAYTPAEDWQDFDVRLTTKVIVDDEPVVSFEQEVILSQGYEDYTYGWSSSG